MEAAAASLAVVPSGKGRKRPDGKTLAQFAAEADMESNTLLEYRRVHEWLGGNYRYLPTIRSYSVAVEAMKSDQFKSAEALVARIELDPAPTLTLEGHEPYAFPRWTVDALRVYLGKKPTNTTLIALKAIETGKDARDRRGDCRCCPRRGGGGDQGHARRRP